MIFFPFPPNEQKKSFFSFESFYNHFLIHVLNQTGFPSYTNPADRSPFRPPFFFPFIIFNSQLALKRHNLSSFLPYPFSFFLSFLFLLKESDLRTRIVLYEACSH